MSNPKNVLLITADQWRGDCLSLADHPIVQTPGLDRLASESVTFRKHFTNAVPCGPSRACLHTGMYLHNHRSGTNGTPLDRRFTNWALELRESGYDPVLFGYTHTAMDPRGLPEDHPGLRNDEGILPGLKPVVDMATLCTPWRNFLANKGYELPENHGTTYGVKKAGHLEQNIPVPTIYDKEHSDTWFLTDEVIRYIKDYSGSQANMSSTQTESGARDQGWCVHLSLRAPHPPWVATEPYNQRYAIEDLPPQIRHQTVEEQKNVHPWLERHLTTGRNQSHANEYRHKLLQASYYSLMSEVDDNMTRLVNYLAETNQLENTLLIFTSDHGEQMGDHWQYGKAGFYDQSYHIPLIIRTPHGISGTVSEFTGHVDIMPTILDWLQLEIPRQCDGQSLLPFLSGANPKNWREAIQWEFDFRNSDAEIDLNLNMESACLNVYRDNEFKYVHFAGLPELLFDLKKDPDELHNVAGSNPTVVSEYARKLLSWRMRHTDKTLSHVQLSRDRGMIVHKRSV